MVEIYLFGTKESGRQLFGYYCTGHVNVDRLELIAMDVKRKLHGKMELRNEVPGIEFQECDVVKQENCYPLKECDFDKIKKLIESNVIIDYIGIRLNDTRLNAFLGNAVKQIVPEGKKLSEIEKYIEEFEVAPGLNLRMYPRPRTEDRRHESYDVIFLYNTEYSGAVDRIKEKISKILGRKKY